mmetsp:Transcript_37935/g.90099  ORF Transcript_37935/g.90099 Transcript_37935/m.90099 type:complete len:409 (+) Transcript_37935:198-1424(+)
MASKRDVSKEQNERHKRILRTLLKKDENRCCADCHARGPTWASVNLGVFLCLQCSGIHRSLGVHVSVVRSTNLDTWLPEQVAFLQRMDNQKASEYWEAALPRNFRRPQDAQQQELERFVRDKYIGQLYRDRDMPPPTIANYKEHPLTAADSAPAPEPPATAAPATLAPPAASKPPAPEPPSEMLGDLLSLDDGPPAAQEAAKEDAAWAPFEEAPTAAPSSGAAAAAAAPDPFASPGVTTPDAVVSAPAADSPTAPPADPFAPPSAAPAAPSVDTPAPPPRAKMSTEDIMKLYDAPAATPLGFAPGMAPAPAWHPAAHGSPWGGAMPQTPPPFQGAHHPETLYRLAANNGPPQPYPAGPYAAPPQPMQFPAWPQQHHHAAPPAHWHVGRGMMPPAQMPAQPNGFGSFRQ